jgi:hypothetical protein
MMNTHEIRSLRHEVVGLRKDLNQLIKLLKQDSEVSVEIAAPPIKESIDAQISNILINYQVPAQIKGFRYLKEAIKMELEENMLADGITKTIYPIIAKKNNDTPSRVERAMRHAVESSAYSSLSPYRKPTNSQFIALLAEKMRMQGA